MKPYYNKEDSLIIKGTAIIMMFFLHFWGLLFVCEFCIALFSMSTGYYYYFVKDKTYHYSLIRIGKLLKIYIIVLAILLLAGAIFMKQSYTVKDLLMEPITNNTVIYAWYVRYYIILMLIAPLMVKKIRNPFVRMLIVVTASLAVYYIIDPFRDTMNPGLYSFFSGQAVWTPAFFLGYSIGELGLFEKADALISKYLTTRLIRNFTIFMIIVLSLILIFEFDASAILGKPGYVIQALKCMVFATSAYISIVYLIKNSTFRPVRRVIAALGRESAVMWLLHSICFSYEAVIIRPLIYFAFIPLRNFPRTLPVITVWALIVFYVASLLIRLAMDICSRKISRHFTNSRGN